MNALALQQLEIIRKVEQLPDAALASLNCYLDQFWKRPLPTPRSLKGIWKDQGFERIPDLEGELRNLRAELSRVGWANILLFAHHLSTTTAIGVVGNDKSVVHPTWLLG